MWPSASARAVAWRTTRLLRRAVIGEKLRQRLAVLVEALLEELAFHGLTDHPQLLRLLRLDGPVLDEEAERLLVAP